MLFKSKKIIFGALLFPLVLFSENIIEINNKISGNGIAETYISGYSFTNKKVTYEKKSDLAIFEGDIILGEVSEAEEWISIHNKQTKSSLAPRSIIITGDRYRWENNIIPYQLDENVNAGTRQNVLNSLSHWEANTALEFVERTVVNAGQYPDYIKVVSDEYACWSYVGKIGGEQKLNVVEACGFGSTVHEFGHAIGLWHEQSREDRDDYVVINWENINESQQHNFNQHIFDADDIGTYDYNSIMHYGAYAFTKNGLKTITTLDADAIIGNRSGLSVLDIVSIRQNYPAFKPVAVLDNNTYSVVKGNSLFIDGRNSFDPNGDPLTYYWNFGDGTTSTTTSNTVNHTYTALGNYALQLTVRDSDGNSHTDTATVEVINDVGVASILPIILYILED